MTRRYFLPSLAWLAFLCVAVAGYLLAQLR